MGHWSREFAKPSASTRMGVGTGLSDGTGKPNIQKALWHKGKLYMAGAWESGADGEDPTRSLRNDTWHLWSWSPVTGYEVIAHSHSAQGGRGPDGVIKDFLFLPDDRLVVAGSFTRLDNPGGTRYHHVNALGIYDHREPTANRWRPLGTVQYNGTVSAGGSIYALAYDATNDALYVGGTFGGIGGVMSPKIHRYDFGTGGWVPLPPGVWGAKPIVHKIWVDESVSPPRVYVGGKFHYTGGDGHNPDAGGTARWSTGFATYREGEGWTTFPAQTTEKLRKEHILQRAGDYAHFDAVHVLDFLVDGDDIWIVGAFSEGAGQEPLRGIARWDAARQVWVDPTGRGGLGREVFSIAKAGDGRIYVAGAFGGRKGEREFYQGFRSGDPAPMAACYDPATDTWDTLGPGLSGRVMPECRLTVAGDDVFFVGDFNFVDPKHFGRTAPANALKSWYIARYNASVDFDAGTPPLPLGADDPLHLTEPAADTPAFTGNEHWSRRFVKPPRQVAGRSQQSGATGMDDGFGAPTQTNAMAWLGDTLYIAGNWEVQSGERWFVWSYHAERGWERVGYQARGGVSVGADSPPAGMKVHDGKLYVYGAISKYAGIGVYDPAAGEWSQLAGTYRGARVEGNAVEQRGGPIHDVAWDSRTGDMYLVGSCGLTRPEDDHPHDVAQVFRVDAQGEYHTMGYMLGAEDPNKPVLGIYAIHLDETQEPTDVYIGGTFNTYGPTPTSHARMAYNVARWSHAEQDWRPLGKGVTFCLSELDRGYYPEGLPGLPAHPGDEFTGFLVSGFPRVRCLTMDAKGDLYAAGAVAVVEKDVLPVKDRRESFGIVRYDRAADRWVPATTTGGVSRDIHHMSWVDDHTLLLSGSFVYDDAWNLLNNVALLDVTTGELRPLGGGLMRSSRNEVIGACVAHATNDEGYWFAGLFDYAGVNVDFKGQTPIQAHFFAHWDPTRSLDPADGIELAPVAPLEGVRGFSSQPRKVVLELASDPGGTVTWYVQSTTGKFRKKGQGLTFRDQPRVKGGQTEVVYFLSVTDATGAEGPKIPVIVPVNPA